MKMKTVMTDRRMIDSISQKGRLSPPETSMNEESLRISFARPSHHTFCDVPSKSRPAKENIFRAGENKCVVVLLDHAT